MLRSGRAIGGSGLRLGDGSLRNNSGLGESQQWWAQLFETVFAAERTQ